MGHIIERKRKDGSVGYTAQIRKKANGEAAGSLCQTFDRRPAAEKWIARTEKELKNGARSPELRGPEKTLSDVVKSYMTDLGTNIGSTKEQCLNRIKTMGIADKNCSEIQAHHIVDLARALSPGRKPQTVGNYLMHLSPLFSIGEIAYRAALDEHEMRKALKTCRALGLISKSAKRDRRPSLEELDDLMTRFEIGSHRTNSAPMHKIVAFAIASARRLSEITRLEWRDYRPSESRILVRDMKHPGEKRGNDVLVDLPPMAKAVIESMPKLDAFIFPYCPESLGAAFQRARDAAGIKDLHFHDLRHEGCSLLAEEGWSIPRIMTVSGHRTWASLERYTQFKLAGDKFEGWKWWKTVAEPEPAWRIEAMERNLQRRRARSSKGHAARPVGAKRTRKASRK